MAQEKQRIFLSIENSVLKNALTSFLSRFYIISNDQNHDLRLTDTHNNKEKTKVPCIMLYKQEQKEHLEKAANIFFLESPFYAGQLLEKIEFIFSDTYKFLNKSNISFGAHKVDREKSIFIHGKTGKETLLTDKECDIFAALYDAKDMHLDKKALLEQVWGYGENIETHTLETHIYRLRQKIEDIPSTPDIILTEEDGYRLCSK